MEIRKTTLEDLEVVMDLFAHARQYMRANGNLNQWTNGYPGRDIILKDIGDKNSYVCIHGRQIVGTFCYIQGTDPTYINIYEGEWLNDEPYGVIHRLASSSHNKGVASLCLRYCLQECSNIKIDTHRDNVAMQNLLEKHGFTKCGIIYLENGSERIAYQKNEQ